MSAPSRVRRAAAALAIGALAAAFLWGFTVRRRLPGLATQSDLAIQWFCARVLWAGGDPYLAAGPGRAFEWPAPLVYPATALVALGPFAALPLHVAECAFVGVGSATLAYVVTRRTWAPLCVFLSAPFMVAVTTVQWSPLLAAAALVPGLAWLVAVKPTVGLVIAAYRPSRRWLAGALAGGLLLTVLALARDPGWVRGWLHALGERPAASVGAARGIGTLYAAPVLLPGGVVVLLALLRWRRPEARLLAAMACVPHIMTGYELVPLLALVPATLAEGLLVAAASWVARYGFAFGQPYPDLAAAYRAAGTWGLWCVLVPLTLLVLARPNAAPGAHAPVPSDPAQR
ncbi:MAG: hypothetical protein ACXW61_02435 [Gemmatirosa sp.]